VHNSISRAVSQNTKRQTADYKIAHAIYASYRKPKTCLLNRSIHCALAPRLKRKSDALWPVRVSTTTAYIARRPNCSPIIAALDIQSLGSCSLPPLAGRHRGTRSGARLESWPGIKWTDLFAPTTIIPVLGSRPSSSRRTRRLEIFRCLIVLNFCLCFLVILARLVIW